jgi:hypothetical protein
MNKRRLVLPALLMLALTAGCASKNMEMAGAAPPYPDAEMAAMPAEMGGDYDEAPGMYDDAEYELDGANMSASEGARHDAPKRRAKMSKKGGVPSQTVSSPAPTAGQGEPTPEPAIGDEDQQPDDHGRQIIYTANMQIGVYNVGEAMKVAEAIPERLGGWVHSRSEGHISMKIPAEYLKQAMEELSGLGNVVLRDLQAQDVTAEYTDLDTRIKVLRETQTQLLELLKRSKTVEEALNVRRALDDVTMQLELALGRMRQLQSQISFSSLTLTLIEQGPYSGTPSSNDPFPWVDSLGVEATEWR